MAEPHSGDRASMRDAGSDQAQGRRNHRAGCHNTLPSYTGLEQMVPDNTITRDTFPPSMGSICEYLRATNVSERAATELPDYIYMPCYLGWGQAIRRAGPYGGFLGKRFDAYLTDAAYFLAVAIIVILESGNWLERLASKGEAAKAGTETTAKREDERYGKMSARQREIGDTCASVGQGLAERGALL